MGDQKSEAGGQISEISGQKSKARSFERFALTPYRDSWHDGASDSFPRSDMSRGHSERKAKKGFFAIAQDGSRGTDATHIH